MLAKEEEMGFTGEGCRVSGADCVGFCRIGLGMVKWVGKVSEGIGLVEIGEWASPDLVTIGMTNSVD